MAAYQEAASEQILGPVAMLMAVLLGAALVIGGWDPKPAEKKQASAE